MVTKPPNPPPPFDGAMLEFQPDKHDPPPGVSKIALLVMEVREGCLVVKGEVSFYGVQGVMKLSKTFPPGEPWPKDRPAAFAWLDGDALEQFGVHAATLAGVERQTSLVSRRGWETQMNPQNRWPTNEFDFR